MAHDQPGRLSGILERIQDMQGLPQTGEMLLGQIQQKAGDAPCMAGCIGAGGRVYEDKQRQTHLRLAQGNHGTIFRRSQRAAWPALCPHARNPQHVRAVLPHRCHTGHETHCQGVSFPFFRVKGLLPLGSSPFVNGLATPEGAALIGNLLTETQSMRKNVPVCEKIIPVILDGQNRI